MEQQAELVCTTPPARNQAPPPPKKKESRGIQDSGTWVKATLLILTENFPRLVSNLLKILGAKQIA